MEDKHSYINRLLAWNWEWGDAEFVWLSVMSSNIQRWRRNSPRQDGSNVSNEPLRRVEAQDADPVVALQTKLLEDNTYFLKQHYVSCVNLEYQIRNLVS